MQPHLHLNWPRFALSILALAGHTAFAAEPALAEGGWYGGLTVGAALVQPRHLDPTHDTDADGRVSGGAFLGVRLGQIPVADGLPVDLELGYQDIARHTVHYKTANGRTALTARGHAVSLAARVGLLQKGNFSLYGKVGVERGHVTASTPAGQPTLPIDGSATGALGALGVEWHFDNRVLLRAEATHFGKVSPKASASGLSFGVGYSF